MNDDVRPSDLRSLERRIATWMADEAFDTDATAELDQILTATSPVRPEPRWLALLKEPPMRLSSGPRVAVGLPARGLVLTLIVLAALAVGAAGALVGSQLLKSSAIEPSVTNAPSASAPPTGAQFLWRSTAPGEGFAATTSLAFDHDGRIWATDGANDRFAIFDRAGTFIEYWGSSGTGDGQFNLRRPNGDTYGMVAFQPDGQFFVLDVGNGRIQQFDSGRHFTQTWSTTGTGAQYGELVAIAVGSDSTLYVLDDGIGIIEKRDATGTFLASIPAFGDAAPGVNTSNGLALDAGGNLYVSLAEVGQVLKLDPNGTVLVTYGATGAGQFVEQADKIAIDAAGRVFVTQGPTRGDKPGVLVFSADGQYLGGFGPLGSNDGQLYFPTGILLDGAGNAYVEDDGINSGPRPVISSLQMFRLGPPFIN